MATTPNYNWDLPDVGSDQDQWGNILNNAIGVGGGVDTIDTDLKTVDDAAFAAQGDASQALTDAAAALAAAEAAQTTADDALPKAGGVLTGRVDGHTGTVKFVSLGTVSGAINMDVSQANYQEMSLDGAATLDFTGVGVAPAGQAIIVVVDLKSNTFAVTWAMTVIWSGGVEPTLSATGKDVFSFISLDNGASWQAAFLQKDVR